MLIQRSEAPKKGLPDLDDFFKKLAPSFKKKVKDPFQEDKSNVGWWTLTIVLLLLVLIGFSSMITVKSGEALIVTRFGAYYKTYNPGLHWTIPVIDQRTLVNLQETATASIQPQNLTEDGNLVNVSVNLAYQIIDPKAYLFSGSTEEAITADLSEATTAVISQSNFADLLNNANWKQVGSNIAGNLNDLSQYGIKVTGVQVQSVEVPNALTQDFSSAISAAETNVKQSLSDANTFAAALQPLGAQQAANALSYADAEKFATMVNATRDAAEVSSLVPAYQTDSEVTLAYLPLLLENNWHNVQAISAAGSSSGSQMNTNQASYLRWQSASQQQQAEGANNEEN